MVGSYQSVVVSCRLAAYLGFTVVPIAFATAQETESRTGHGSVSLNYQYLTADSLESTIGEIPIGPVDTHSLNVQLDYHLNEKLTLSAGLPYVRKRYRGSLQHDPLLLDPPRPYLENIDQGQWNTGLQDIHLGARYLLSSSRTLSIEPFVSLEIPSHEYNFFGNAAVGQHVRKLQIGSSFVFEPGLSDAYYSFDLGYVFVERTLGVSIDHWRVNAEVGYYFRPRLSGRLFALLKHGHGLSFPDNFPLPRSTELWYQHDRLVKHNYTNAGVGVTWAFSDKHQLAASWMTMTHGEVVHKLDYGLDVALSWSF